MLGAEIFILVVGLLTVVLLALAYDRDVTPSPLELELRRIAGEVRNARRELDRLEAEAMRAMHDEVIRHQLGRAR